MDSSKQGIQHREEKGVSRIVVKGDFRFHYAGPAADLESNQDAGA